MLNKRDIERCVRSIQTGDNLLLDDEISELRKKLEEHNNAPYEGIEQMNELYRLERLLNWLLELKRYRHQI